tara:strand:+ start:325 stop:912 length:588 start_codon:yes stop_codon:yes gene_type:complete
MYDPRMSEDNPANAAYEQLGKIPGIFNKYYKPYQQQGQQVDPALMKQYMQMFQNPGEFFSQIGQGYQQSPGYQRALQEALGAGSNAAAAGGMLGTPMHQEANMATAQDLASKDYQGYINNIMQMLGIGGEGLGKFSQRGYEAGTAIGSGLADVQSQKAKYGYEGQAAENARREARRNAWIKAIGGIGGGIASAIL